MSDWDTRFYLDAHAVTVAPDRGLVSLRIEMRSQRGDIAQTFVETIGVPRRGTLTGQGPAAL